MGYLTLELTLISARDLKNVNLIGVMDVYVVVTLSHDPKSKQKTRVHQDGGTKPSWNHTMKFTVDEQKALQSNSVVIFEIKHESFGPDKEIGEVRVPISELISTSKNQKASSKQFAAYQVRRPSGKSQGELNISYQVTEAPEAMKSGSDNPVGYGYAYGGGGSSSSGGYGGQPPVAAYPPPGHAAGAGAYPPPAGGPPPQAGYAQAYPAPAGYPGQGSGAPPPGKGSGVPYQAGYGHPPPPPPGQGYPPAQQGYPPAQGYPPSQGYPPAQYGGGGYPPQQQYGYPGQHGAGGYPGQYNNQKPQKPKKSGGGLGMGLGAGLLGGAIGGLILGDIVSDAAEDSFDF